MSSERPDTEPSEGAGEVTSSQVLKIAHLARLSIDAEEVPTLTSEFNKILGLFATLKEFDTSEVKPMSHVLDESNVLRLDTTAPSIEKEGILRSAPDRKGSFFKVPLVIDS